MYIKILCKYDLPNLKYTQKLVLLPMCLVCVFLLQIKKYVSIFIISRVYGLVPNWRKIVNLNENFYRQIYHSLPLPLREGTFLFWRTIPFCLTSSIFLHIAARIHLNPNTLYKYGLFNLICCICPALCFP